MHMNCEMGEGEGGRWEGGRGGGMGGWRDRKGKGRGEGGVQSTALITHTKCFNS